MDRTCKLFISTDVLVGPAKSLDRRAQEVYMRIAEGLRYQKKDANPYTFGLIMRRVALDLNKRKPHFRAHETGWEIYSISVCTPDIGEEDLLDRRFDGFWTKVAFIDRWAKGYGLYNVARNVTEINETDEFSICAIKIACKTLLPVLPMRPKWSSLSKQASEKVFWILRCVVPYAPAFGIASVFGELWFTRGQTSVALDPEKLAALMDKAFGQGTAWFRDKPEEENQHE